jgi:hypothetical protein
MHEVQYTKQSIISESKERTKYVVGIIVVFTILVIILNVNTCFGLNFGNYTSERYQIQFQYPSTWEVKEKMGRFDEGVDLQISDPNLSAMVLIQNLEDPATSFASSDLTPMVYDYLKESIGDFSYDYTVVEQPSFTTTIDGQRAGTFVYAWKDKYEDYAQRWGTQKWMVFEGNRGRLISFTAPASAFDSADNTLIRDQLIKSINFLGQSNATNTNMTNLGRFAE